MPFAIIIVAAILIVTGFRGTASDFLSTFAKDMAGFVVWIVAIGVVGAVGFIPNMKKISDAFLILILLVMFLSNKAFFASFNQQIRNPASSTGQAPTDLSTLPNAQTSQLNNNSLIGQSAVSLGSITNLSPVPSLPGLNLQPLGLQLGG